MTSAAESAPPIIELGSLIDRYRGFLIDAYGVLLDDSGPLPGAVEFLDRLDRQAKPWLIVTNAASRLPEQLAADFRAKGLPLDAGDFLTSGMLLESYFAEAGLRGASCLLLGPETATGYIERAGARRVAPEDAVQADVLVIADQQGVRWPEDLNGALNLILRRTEAGLPLHLVLCNPDLIFPCAPGEFSLTAGALAVMLESVVQAHVPQHGLEFVRLGKPNRPIFDAARARLATAPLVMIGDQLGSDIRGAVDAGIDSVLVGTGLAGGAAALEKRHKDIAPPRPTWRLPDLLSWTESG